LFFTISVLAFTPLSHLLSATHIRSRNSTRAPRSDTGSSSALRHPRSVSAAMPGPRAFAYRLIHLFVLLDIFQFHPAAAGAVFTSTLPSPTACLGFFEPQRRAVCLQAVREERDKAAAGEELPTMPWASLATRKRKRIRPCV
jgi:hypothetical protein